MYRIFGKHPGKTIHRIGVAFGGIFITSTIINVIWSFNYQFSSNPNIKSTNENKFDSITTKNNLN